MIAVDTSALAAILFLESEAEVFERIVRSNRRVLVGMPTILEFSMVASGRSHPFAASDAKELVAILDVEHVAFDAQHLAAAAAAFDRFGKGRHPAALNFGDCMAYSVAAVAGCPLLFKGDDFRRTDIIPATE